MNTQIGHHSLVTPIDWKPLALEAESDLSHSSHYSLVTPIDWKPLSKWVVGTIHVRSHHSLVTPIDWKRRHNQREDFYTQMVTTRW